MSDVSKQYPFIDAMRFFFACVIVGIHTDIFCDFGVLDMGFGVFSRLAVPAFFVISGFLYFRKPVSGIHLLHYLKRCGILYFAFSFIFFLLSVVVLARIDALWYLRLISLYGFRHLWFLYALMIGISSLTLLDKLISCKKIIYIISFVLLIVGCLVNTYGAALGIMIDDSVLKLGVVRGILEALPALAAGMYLVRRNNKMNLSRAAVGFVISFTLFCAETVFAVKYLHVSSTVCWLLVIPCVYYLIAMGTNNTGLKVNLFVRKTATLLYLVHPVFILLLNPVMPNGLLLFATVLTCSLIVALGMYLGSKSRFGAWMKYLM